MRIRKVLLAPFVLLLAIPKVMAHCPLCTAATGAAVVTARYYGVHDSIVGVFIGAFAFSTGLWVHNTLKKRGWIFSSAQAFILSIASLIITIVSLHIAKLFEASESLLGMPSLLTGILIGSIASATAYSMHQLVRDMHENKNLVPLQGLIVLLVGLLVAVITLGVAL